MVRTASFTPLPFPLNDTVSAICPINNQYFAIGDWSGSISIIDINSNGSVFTHKNELNSPIFCMIFFPPTNSVYVGTADGTLFIYNLNTLSPTSKKLLTSAIRTINIVDENIIIGSWDGNIYVFNRELKEIYKDRLMEKIFAVDIMNKNLIAIGMSGQKNACVYLNLTNMNKQNILVRLQYQLRSVTFVDDRDIAIGSIDGRTQIINIFTSGPGFIFKNHKKFNDVFAVNFIGIFPLNRSVIYTAGSDGNIIFINRNTRVKLLEVHSNVPITALTFVGSYLIFANGDDWSRGSPENHKNVLNRVDVGQINS